MIGDNTDLTSIIRREAFRLGFLDCGFSRVKPLLEIENSYHAWLAKGYHAGMDYMARNNDKRLDPSLLVPGAKSVISLLYNYYPSQEISSPLIVAKYAYGEDYHDVVKGKLFQLDAFIRISNDDAEQRCFVDSAPVLERFWAQNSGLGWMGKNSCLISRKHGSFFFIAEIITSLELQYDEPFARDYCGTCQRCIEACPTGAITPNRTVDSNRCISYQTIENKSEIPTELEGKFQNRIFGCDICQDVCPWNRKVKPHSEPSFLPNEKLRSMTSADWQNLDKDTFRQLFRKSAVKRAKYAGLKRNIDFVKGD
ncbi:MAG: tRNA epoxyqueuosine(34) reductase QueG [Bacteroidota bacterium]|nr:tRNA epoxyqueuosine(34) reductase QueG [Bacteroidota bacterium]